MQGDIPMQEHVGTAARAAGDGQQQGHIESTHLDQGDGDDGLGVDQLGDVQVVQATVSEDLGAGLEPHWLGRAGLVQLGHNAAQGAEHGPAGVDHLHGPELLEGGGVGGQADGVPAVVAGELASQVRGDIALGEGACKERGRGGSKGERACRARSSGGAADRETC